MQGAASLLRLASPLLAVLLLGLGLAARRASAQSEQPLQGHGVDPVTDGVWTGNGTVPVYFSISLEKLEQVDEKGYTFNAVFTVVLSWRDPRVNKTINLYNFLGSDSKAQAAQQLHNCTAYAALTGGVSNPDCQSAITNGYSQSSCSNPCFMGNGYACCDGIWQPGFTIPNILYQSQDRVTQDFLWLYGASVGPLSGDWNSVLRIVRLQAVFSNLFDFRKFPFDKQSLVFQVSPTPPANHHMVPSIVGRSLLGPYGFVFQYDGKAFPSHSQTFSSGSATFATDQVTGWTFQNGNNSVTMTCQDSPDTGTTPYVDPNDPQYAAYHNPLLHPAVTVTSSSPSNMTCSVSISIARLSSYYVLNDLIPVVVTVLLAFTVVFAKPSDLDIRLSTLVTLFLALVAVQFIIADQLPRTSYTTAFGFLVLISYLVLVILIAESLFVFYISILEEVKQRKAKMKEKQRERSSSREDCMPQEAVQPLGEEEEDNADGKRPESADPPKDVESGDEEARTRLGTFLRPFTYTKERLENMFDDSNEAFHVASRIDNISLLILGLGYIVAIIVLFTYPWPPLN